VQLNTAKSDATKPRENFQRLALQAFENFLWISDNFKKRLFHNLFLKLSERYMGALRSVNCSSHF